MKTRQDAKTALAALKVTQTGEDLGFEFLVLAGLGGHGQGLSLL